MSPSLWLSLSAAALLLAPAASAVTMTWVTVGAPGNVADQSNANCGSENTSPCGAVAYTYHIGKYEVTNLQYAEFLNNVAATDTYQVYNTSMNSHALGGITRSGSSGSYSYAVKAGFESKPVNFVSFWDSLRFINWLNNGQGSGDTETGVYTMEADGLTNWKASARNPAATIFLPSEDEWYKAAFYDPIAGLYYDYPTGTDATTGCAAPGSDTGNSANCRRAEVELTDVGAYTLSEGPNGTFDQGGNVWEWNEQKKESSYRGVRGGAYPYDSDSLAAGDTYYDYDPADGATTVGFRIASTPEPSTGLLVMTGLLGFAFRQRQHRRGA